MTENTPTPAELSDQAYGLAYQYPMSDDERRLLVDSVPMVLSALLAERDALAAVIEQAPHDPLCQRKRSLRGKCTCWKSTAPATVLAQRDARVRSEERRKIVAEVLILASTLPYGETVDPRDIADRIEREAQDNG